MKTDIRMILRDIQAAARIGHVESLWAALDQLQDIPQIGGNHPLNETLINQVVLPAGKAVSRTRINREAMRPLISHPFAAYRAVAGVALVTRFLSGINNTTLKDLNQLVQDPRADVREAIRMAVAQISDPEAEKLDALYTAWQKSDSPWEQGLAYQILPHLPEEMVLEKVNALQDQAKKIPVEVRNTLVATLSDLSARGHTEAVFQILSNWADHDDPDIGIVALSLTKPWAAGYPDQSLEILTRLAASAGTNKRIRKALENLDRNGAEEQVKAILESWRSSDDLQLQAAGNDEKLNI